MPTSIKARPGKNQDCTPRIVQASKTATILKMLQTANGATIEELSRATGWQQHSVRASLSLLRKRGSHIDKTRSDGGNRYRVSAPGEVSVIR